MQDNLPEQIFYAPHWEGQLASITGSEWQHCFRVLRHTIGDELVLCNGHGFFARGILKQAEKDQGHVQISESWEEAHTAYRQIHIAVAPTKKADKMEWLLEKAIEIGLGSITFLQTKRTERNRLKPERLEKIARSAMKQSKHATLPHIAFSEFTAFLKKTPTNANSFIAIVADSGQTAFPKQLSALPSHVLIGPEGGFTETEIAQAQEAAWHPVSLGPNRLRTETAALVACHLMNLGLAS